MRTLLTNISASDERGLGRDEDQRSSVTICQAAKVPNEWKEDIHRRPINVALASSQAMIGNSTARNA
jgi:hypothetical protein